MIFWDSSAVLPLLAHDSSSNRMLDLLREDPTILVWTMTATECRSALHARYHEEASPKQGELMQALKRLKQLEGAWIEVQQVAWVKKRAERILAIHSLSTSAALHLAAALIACEDRPDNLPIITFDPELAQCALREGFQVLGIEV